MCWCRFFNNSAGVRPATCCISDSSNNCFPEKFPKSLKTRFLQNTYGRLLLDQWRTWTVTNWRLTKIINVTQCWNFFNVIISAQGINLFKCILLNKKRHFLFSLSFFSFFWFLHISGISSYTVFSEHNIRIVI